MKTLVCRECKKEVANTRNVLARHVRTHHDMEWASYVVKHELAGEWPTCACGCGQALPWRKGGFGKYIRGHDVGAFVDAFSQPGWFVNPFTGQEECIMLDDELALFRQCIRNNDPVTHDTSLRIPWEDSTGSLRFVIPSFRSLKSRVVLLVDDPGSLGYAQRSAGLKRWCVEHSYTLLVLKRMGDTFDVVDVARPV
jgi:hypothetical protein